MIVVQYTLLRLLVSAALECLAISICQSGGIRSAKDIASYTICKVLELIHHVTFMPRLIEPLPKRVCMKSPRLFSGWVLLVPAICIGGSFVIDRISPPTRDKL